MSNGEIMTWDKSKKSFEKQNTLFAFSKKDNDPLYCKNCLCMTNTKRGYVYICGKCGKDRRVKV